MVLCKQKQKEWCGNHIKKGACVEGNRKKNMLEDGT